MIDWHSHILPGLDDGADDTGQSLAMAAALCQAGFTTVYCTPHLMRGCYEATNDQVRQGVAGLQAELERNNIPLTLLPGREYCLDEFLPELLEQPLTLGSSREILVEILPHATADMVRSILYGVVRSGLTPVIAHPERSPLLEPVARRSESGGLLSSVKNLLTGGSRDREQSDLTGNPLLEYLRDLGCSFQGNLGSFSGFYGRQVKGAAERMKTAGIYDRFGSDLHSPEHAALIFTNDRHR